MTPTRRTLRAAGAAALLSVLVLAGCSEEEPLPEPAAPTTSAPTTQAPPVDDDEATTAPADDEAATTAPVDDEAATQTAVPEAGSTLNAADDSFAIELPEGWEDACDLVDQDGVLLAAKEIERKDEFFSNVVVTQEEYVSNLTSAVEEAAEQLAGENGEYQVLEPAAVDGNRAPGYTLVRDVQGSTIHQTQRWISHDGTLYVVTFSAIKSQAENAAGTLDEILASWTWDPPRGTAIRGCSPGTEAPPSQQRQALQELWSEMSSADQDATCVVYGESPDSLIDGFMQEAEGSFDQQIVRDFYSGKCG